MKKEPQMGCGSLVSASIRPRGLRWVHKGRISQILTRLKRSIYGASCRRRFRIFDFYPSFRRTYEMREISLDGFRALSAFVAVHIQCPPPYCFLQQLDVMAVTAAMARRNGNRKSRRRDDAAALPSQGEHPAQKRYRGLGQMVP